MKFVLLALIFLTFKESYQVYFGEMKSTKKPETKILSIENSIESIKIMPITINLIYSKIANNKLVLKTIPCSGRLTLLGNIISLDEGTTFHIDFNTSTRLQNLKLLKAEISIHQDTFKLYQKDNMKYWFLVYEQLTVSFNENNKPAGSLIESKSFMLSMHEEIILDMTTVIREELKLNKHEHKFILYIIKENNNIEQNTNKILASWLNKKISKVKLTNVAHSKCKLQSLNIDFESLGWDKEIVVPHKMDVGYCHGNCINFNSNFSEFSNYAIAKSAYNLEKPLKEMKLCCVPTKFKSVSMFFTSFGLFEKADSAEMIVESCNFT